MKKNIAVIGSGYWGKNLVRNFCELNSLYEICDTGEDRLKLLKEKYPDVKVCTNYKILLKNPEIDGVIISSPAITHYSIAKDALLADKDVFVEKPIALTHFEG